MMEVAGGVCAPRGYRASGVCAKIKNDSVTKPDCALIVSDTGASVAGMFTTNVLKSPPAQWTEGVCIRGRARAHFINSGNANACTGVRGVQDVQTMAEWVALGLNVPVTEVCISSTGVIGVPLPMDRIRRGIDGCLDTLTPLGSADAARAIMTTDTVPKELAVEVPLEGGAVRIGGIAKGSGMISPNMATMIAVLTSDAAMAPEHLKALLRECVDVSFNCICVDNDMSTSDNVVVFANGASGLPPLVPGSANYGRFAEALREVCVRLSHMLVRDGEGATKFLEIRVTGTRDDASARTIARSIAHSMLCKTAFFGQDANWGRIACAAGYAGVPFHPEDLCIAIEGLTVVEGGLPTSYAEEEASARMKLRDIHVEVNVGAGPGCCVFWTSDLSYDYVRINADYRS